MLAGPTAADLGRIVLHQDESMPYPLVGRVAAVAVDLQVDVHFTGEEVARAVPWAELSWDRRRRVSKSGAARRKTLMRLPPNKAPV